MQAAKTPTDVLYVGGPPRDGPESLRGCRLSVAPAGESNDWPDSETVDCLLVGEAGPGGSVVEAVGRVRGTYPSTPLVAFTEDSPGDVLDAGATDVVQSPPGEAPEALVQRRIENVCGRDGVPGVADHGSYDDADLFEQLSENLRDVIWVSDPASHPGREITFVSAAYEEIWGRPREHILTGGLEAFYETIHPDDRELVRESTGPVRLGDGRSDITYRVVRPDGEVRWIHDRAFAFGDDGERDLVIGIARDITERKRREQELLELEETLSSALSNVPAVLFAFDEDGVFTRSRGKALEQLGFEPGEAVGQSVFDIYADHPDIRRHCERALEGERVVATVELCGRTLESRYQPLFDDGEVVKVVGHSYDITDSVENQKQLARQNDLFKKAQDIADVGVWEYNLDGPNRWSEQIYDILGATADTTLTLENMEQYYHPADWPEVSAAVTRAVEDGDSFDREVRVVTGDNELRQVHLRGEPQTVNGEVVRIRGTMQDITERVEREREIERNRDFLEQIEKVGDIGGWEYDFRADRLRLSDATCKLLDLPTGTVLNSAELTRCHHPDDRDQITDAITQLWTEGESFAIEVRVLTGEGESKWVYSQGEPVYEDGEVVAMRGVSQDIDGRKQREHRLQAERDLVERILEASPVGIGIHDANGEILRVNERIEELFGIEKEQHEAAGKSPDSIQLISDDVPWSPGEERLAEYVARTGEPVRNEECVVEIPSGERLVLLVDAVPLFEEGELKRVVETYEDVTDRVERERQLEQQNAELDRLNRINHTIRDLNTALVGANSREEIEQAVCDQLSASGRYDHTLVVRASGDELAVQATDGADLPVGELPPEALTRHAVETGDICQPKDIGDGDPAWTVCGAVGADSGTMAAIPLTYDGQTHGALAVCADAPDVLEEGELELLGELGGTVGHAIAAVESREREATLTALYEATQDLLAVGDPQEVCEVVVETAESVLDPLAVGIFLFDDEANVLELAEGTEQMREFFGDSTAFGPGLQDSITWQTYIEGEEKFVPDVHESDNLAHPETDARSSLFLPLGEHGVFVVGTDEPMSLGEQKRNLVGLFAAATEAALDRVVGQAGLRERDRRLEERTTRLQHLKGLFSLVADIDTALREAGTPDELHRSVCEELVDTDPYEFAWVGTISPDGTAVEPRTWADGETRGQAYLDEVAFGLEGDNPAARAARTGDPVCVSNATAHLRAEDWAQTAVEHGYESVLAVPLTHEDATYGVLTVYASETHAFDERARSVFDRLGTLVPEISTGLQRDQTVLADRVVELELSLPDLETFPNAVAATVDHPVRYRHVTPTSDGRTRLVFSLADPPAGALRDIEERFVTVDSLDVVERAGETTLQATLSGSTVATTLLDCGALPHEIVARPDDTAVTVRMPHDADVRLFLDRMAEHYPGVELVSRRDATVHDETEAAAQRALAEDLTDRQREVLRTAYEHGFFESPRATTGVELADILGVSQPTVTHHLREAQRRLFEALFTNG